MTERCEICNKLIAFSYGREHKCDFELERAILLARGEGSIPDFSREKEVLEKIVDGQTPEVLFYQGRTQQTEVVLRVLSDAVYKMINAYEKDHSFDSSMVKDCDISKLNKIKLPVDM